MMLVIRDFFANDKGTFVRFAFGSVAFLVVLGLAGCRNGADSPKNGEPKKITVSHTFSGTHPIKVVCTTGMVADLVRNIGKDRVDVVQLLAHDVDPHLYVANRADMDKLNHAEIIFFNGLHLEGKMGEILDRLARKVPSFGIGDYLPPSRILGEEGEDTHDPHIWFDVSLWSEAAGVVRDALVAFDPPNAGAYRKHADAYQKDLAALHKSVGERIAAIPKTNRLLVTSHDAFRYFGRAYDIEVKGVQGISTEAEASIKDIETLVKLIVDRKVKAVFVESSVNPRNLKSIIEGCAARGHTVTIGGELFSDAMGERGTPSGAYGGMIDHNVDTIVRALK